MEALDHAVGLWVVGGGAYAFDAEQGHDFVPER